MPIILTGDETQNSAWLFPEAVYKQLDYPIDLEDSTQVVFTVEQPEADPVIRLDPNGLVHGLRSGQARIIGEFGGVRDTVVVHVHTMDDAPAGYRGTNR